MGVKPFTKTNQSYLLVSTIILILILLTFFLLHSPLTSSLSINSKSKATPKTPYPGCLQPISISQDRYPLALYGSNLVYSNIVPIGSARYLERDKFYAWNVGPDHKPNTADDLSPVLVNAPGIILTSAEDDYGDLSPKISNRYIIWISSSNNNYSINMIDLGLDGILDPIESLNPRRIYSVPNNFMRINSINLKGSKVSLTYKGYSISQGSLGIGFCDLSLSSGNGSCSPNSTIVFSPPYYHPLKDFGDVYFYHDSNLGETQVLFTEREFLDPQNRAGGPTVYSTYSWSQSSGINLISNQGSLIDLYESLAIVSYQDRIYGYFYPGSIPGTLVQLSSGTLDKNAKANVRNDFSPSGNYLAAYTKGLGQSSNLYLGSLGNGLELKTPFISSDKHFLDSSSSGNYLYVSQFSGQFVNYNLYYTQCFGI